MTTLSVHTFDTAQAAQRRIGRLESTSGRRTVADDAAVISWPDGADRPTAWQASLFSTSRALTGAFWGMLFSHLFLIPLSYAQPPTLAADVAVTSLEPLGLTGPFLTSIRALLGPGTSAILALHPDDALDKLTELLDGDPHRHVEIVLDGLQCRRLLAGFAEETG